MARCIVIPADNSQPLVRTVFVSLPDLQRAVGGWIEEVAISESLSLIVDEDGHSKHLLPNRRATLLRRLFVPAARSQMAILGDVILIGAPFDDEINSVPCDFEQLLIDTRWYVVRATMGGESVVSTPFGTYWAATEIAIVADLRGVLDAVEIIAQE